MEITKEILEKRINELQSQREQLMANLNATVGAIQAYQALIDELDKPKEKVQKIA